MSRSTLHITLLLLAAVSALTGAGCGGDSETASGGYQVRAATTMKVAAPTITKAQFVARVNRICRRAWLTIVDNFSDYSSWQEELPERKARFEKSVQDSLLAGADFHIFDQIRRLGAPPGEIRSIEEIIGPMQITVELGQMGRWRAASADQVAREFRVYNERALRYGLVDCLMDGSNLDALRARPAPQ